MVAGSADIPVMVFSAGFAAAFCGLMGSRIKFGMTCFGVTCFFRSYRPHAVLLRMYLLMDVKKLKPTVWGAIIFSLFILHGAMSGCAMFSAEEDVDDDRVEYADQEKTLFGSISNYDSLFGKGNRTLFSDSLSLDEESFYITGTNSKGATLAPKKLNVSGSSFNVDIPRGFWQLTVFCVHKTNSYVQSDAVSSQDKDWILSNASLIGYLTADLSENAASLPVSLSADGLKGTCAINANFILSNDGGSSTWSVPTGYTCKMHFTNLVRGDDVYYAGTSTAVSRASVTFSSSGAYNFYGSGRISCGNYSIAFEFFDASGKSCGVWSDSFILLPNRDFTGTVHIPNVIGSSPAKPTNFTATYVSGSQDAAGHEGQYKVHFAWKDNSNSENHFELQLADVTGYGQDTLTDLEWSTYNSSKIFTYDGNFKYYKDTVRADGSLECNNEGATFWLTLGKKYQARIRACNNSAPSEWCYVTMPANASGISYDGGILEPFVISGSSTPAKAIGMFRITYNLEGGSYWAAPYASVYGLRLVYYVQDTGADTSVWNGEGYSSTDPYAFLKRKDMAFNGWSNTVGGFPQVMPGASYSGTQNLSLYACYGGSCSRPSSNSEYDLNVEWFSYKVTQGGTVQRIVDAGNYGKVGSICVKRSDIPAGSDTDILMTLAIPADTDPYTAGSQVFPDRFDSIGLKVYGPDGTLESSENRSYPSMSGTPFNGVAIAGLSNGNHDLVYTATKKIGGIDYSWSVKIVVVITD